MTLPLPPEDKRTCTRCGQKKRISLFQGSNKTCIACREIARKKRIACKQPERKTCVVCGEVFYAYDYGDGRSRETCGEGRSSCYKELMRQKLRAYHYTYQKMSKTQPLPTIKPVTSPKPTFNFDERSALYDPFG